MIFDLQAASSLHIGVAVTMLAVGAGILYSTLLKKQDPDCISSAPAVPPLGKGDDRVVLVLGGGTIGGGFAAVFLSQGLKVLVVDPFLKQDVVEKRIAEFWPTIEARGITKLQEAPLKSAFSKTDSLEEALQYAKDQGLKVDFVQECTWEDVDNKQKVLRDVDQLLDPTILIASSTSFIPWTLLVTQCTHKHRIMIGHPSIPHMQCFMEIYGVRPEWVQHCKEWYAGAAFDVIVMKATVPGHVLNSFLRVNLELGHKLVRKGVCSPEDVNKVLRTLGRSFYAQHAFLATGIAIGGDRGLRGGMELVERIKKDAIFLILFSGMKENTPIPDLIARPLARMLGRFLEGILPGPEPETMRATVELERELTENGTIPVQAAMLQKNRIVYEITPLEVASNDPFALPEYKYK